MADNKFEISDNLGDINSVLHNQSVADLSWLSVDEAAYRAAEALPKQNLDMIPELMHALTIDPKEDVQKVIPLKPHVMVNKNPLDVASNPVDAINPIRNRVARLVMEGLNDKEIKSRLRLEFSAEQIKVASAELEKVISETGLLGNVYIDSKIFPKCSQLNGSDRKLVASCGKRSLYVLSKPDCTRCVKNTSGRCASFNKTIVDEIPYTSKLAAHYAPSLVEERRESALTDSSIKTWKRRLQIAFTTPVSKANPDGTQTSHYQPKVKPVKLTPELIRQATIKRETNIVLSSQYKTYASRMMNGHNDVELLSNAKDPELQKLANEYGLLGYSYLDMDALGGCKNTISFIKARKISPDFILRRNSSCSICKNISDGGCAKLCDKIVSTPPSYNVSHFHSALARACNNEIICEQDKSKALRKVASDADFRSLTAQANLLSPKKLSVKYSSSNVKAYYGSHDLKSNESIDPEEIRKFVSHLMNTGLSGTGLQRAILSRYSTLDLKGLSALGKRLASEEHIQGSYYLDPTAYSDYGRGCAEGSSIFKNRGPKNIMASSKCTGCTMQNAPGWCSKYCKSLIRSVPQSVRSASKISLPMIQPEISNPVEEWGLESEVPLTQNVNRKSSISISLDPYSIEQ